MLAWYGCDVKFHKVGQVLFTGTVAHSWALPCCDQLIDKAQDDAAAGRSLGPFLHRQPRLIPVTLRRHTPELRFIPLQICFLIIPTFF